MQSLDRARLLFKEIQCEHGLTLSVRIIFRKCVSFSKLKVLVLKIGGRNTLIALGILS